MSRERIAIEPRLGAEEYLSSPELPELVCTTPLHVSGCLLRLTSCTLDFPLLIASRRGRSLIAIMDNQVVSPGVD